MQTPVQTSRPSLFPGLPGKINRLKRAALLTGLAGLPLLSQAQSTWVGATSTDWNDAANWSAGVPSAVDAIINTNVPNVATISNNFTLAPVDIRIGVSAGPAVRVDHLTGTAFTGDNNWMFIGYGGANATYNFANTPGSGGTFTGFGQGSGDLNVGGAPQNGNIMLGLDNATVSTLNIHSSGTLSAGGLMAGGSGTSSGTVNMDSGTVNLSGEAQFGSSYWSSGFFGRLNMSGGSFNADIISFSRGNSPSSAITGIGNFTGGTVSTKRWFTLGFAGSTASTALVTNNGAAINVNTVGGGNFEMGVWDPLTNRFVLNSGSVSVQNGGSIVFGVLGQSGASTFDQNNGTVTFYSDAGTTIGGSGGIILGSQGIQPWEISSGTFTYNLNGGTLTVPSISKVSSPATGIFNFNGGTIVPAATTTLFLQGLTAANIQSGGANIDTGGFDITIGQGLAGTGILNKIGTGILTLSGANTYTGDTFIRDGTLALSGTATLASQVVIPSGKTLDVTALTVGLLNPISGSGSINGNAVAATGFAVSPATNGTAGTITFNNDLDLNAGGALSLDLSTVYNSGNDQVAVTGNLTVSSATTIQIQALSGSANLSTVADYVLCAVTGTTTLNSTPSLAWVGTPPNNYLSFSVQQSGNNLVLHYTPAVAPTVTATASQSTLVRNQKVTITATVTPGTGPVTNVVVDASQIGGSATANLVLSAAANVYTNTFTVGSSIAPGAKALTVVAKALSGLNSPGFAVNVTVVATNEVWTGAGADDNWTSANWLTAVPATSGDAVTFAGSTRTSPNLDANFSVTGVTFDSTASNFTLGTGNGSTLTLTANGVLNLSANPQTLNLPIFMGGAQTLNASAGNLLLTGSLDKNSSLLTVTGAANTVISGSISGSGSLFKKGTGSLIVPASATWDLTQASSGGFSSPLMAQSGTVLFNGGGVQNVLGELVIGGVIANGGAGNNAKIVVDAATLNVSSWFSIGRGNGTGGVSSDLVVTNGATVTAQNVSAGFNGGNGGNKPKGSITVSDTSSFSVSGGNFHIGESDGSDVTMNVLGSASISAPSATMNVGINSGKGAVNLNGGTISVGALRVGAGANLNSTAQGTVTVNSGTLSSEGDILLGFAGSGAGGDIGRMIINAGGTVNIATATTRWFIMNQWDTCASQLDINGGTLNLNANTPIRYAIGNNTGTNVINLNSGAITCYSDNATTVGGAGVVDMHQGNGSTVQNSFNLNGGTLTTFGILSANNSGTRKFNFNGGTLKAVADNGAFVSLGTGSATANVRAGGAVIDTAGFNVGIPQALLNNGVDQDGGLTKNGNGTLILSGNNTYTNSTRVNAGTLTLTQPVLSTVASAIVASSAILDLNFTGTNQVKALVLNGVTQAPGVYSTATSPSFITGTGYLLVPSPIASYSTNISYSVTGNSMTITWPSTHLGWILQAQTNSLNVGLSANWVDVAGSDTTTSATVGVSPSSPSVFYRLRKP